MVRVFFSIGLGSSGYVHRIGIRFNFHRLWIQFKVLISKFIGKAGFFKVGISSGSGFGFGFSENL